jgi:hypothetical protein
VANSVVFNDGGRELEIGVGDRAVGLRRPDHRAI